MCPGTPSRPNWRSTRRPYCCGAFEGERTWVRTVSADEIANVFTRHLGFASGLLPDNALWWSQGETGQMVALWRPPQVWPVALQREAFQPPARLRLPMPGLVFICSPGAGALGLCRPGTAQRHRPSSSTALRPSTSSRTGGPAPAATASPKRSETDTRVLLPVLFLPYRRHQGPVEEAPRQPASVMGGTRWTN